MHQERSATTAHHGGGHCIKTAESESAETRQAATHHEAMHPMPSGIPIQKTLQEHRRGTICRDQAICNLPWKPKSAMHREVLHLVHRGGRPCKGNAGTQLETDATDRLSVHRDALSLEHWSTAIEGPETHCMTNSEPDVTEHPAPHQEGLHRAHCRRSHGIHTAW